MKKHIGLSIMVLLMLLVSCRSDITDRSPIPAPGDRITALEAYEQIRPSMTTWHEDAGVVSISSVVGAEPKWRVDSEGKAPWWLFTVQSPSTLKTTEISWIAGQVIVGLDQIPNNEFTAPSAEEELPLQTMLDSNEAIGIAAGSSINLNWILLDIGIDRYDSANNKHIPPSWTLTYAHPDDSTQNRRVMIDAVTGEILRNDFAEP